MSRISVGIMALLASGAMAACGGSSSSKSRIAGPSESQGKAPAAAGSPGGATQPSSTVTATSAAGPSSGATSSLTAVRSCLRQAGLSVDADTAARTLSVSDASATTLLVDQQVDEAHAQFFVKLENRHGHRYDLIGLYVIGPATNAAEHALAARIERCIH